MLLLIIAGAYGIENFIKEYGLKSATLIRVTNNSVTAAYISDDILSKLMEQELKDDNISKGPKLLTALNAAGVGNFSEIEVMGKGSSKPVTFSENNIDKTLILYPAGNGRVNLCTNDGAHLLVKEVNEIDVKS